MIFFEGFVCWRHERAQQEYEARSRNWIWSDKFTSYVIIPSSSSYFQCFENCAKTGATCKKKLPIFFMLIKDLLKRNIAVSRKKLALSLQFDVWKFWFLLIIIGIPEFSNMSLTAINNQHLWKSGYDVAWSAVWGAANELRMHLWTELEHRIHTPIVATQ